MHELIDLMDKTKEVSGLVQVMYCKEPTKDLYIVTSINNSPVSLSNLVKAEHGEEHGLQFSIYNELF